MIIRIALLLVLAALPVFLGVELLLWFAIPILPSALTLLGSALLLFGFAILIFTSLWGVSKISVLSIINYFSSKQRLQRRIWFIDSRQDQLKRLLYFKIRQISYFNELHRKRLLKCNNRKHIKSLSIAIDKNLLSIKANLTELTYRQLQQDHALYKSKKDIEALLALQKKIATFI